MIRLNLKNKKFGKWTVLSYIGAKKKNTYWLCRCECGREREVCVAHLNSGMSLSCGCFTGVSKHPAYGIWRGIKTRCYNKSSPNFRNYGAKGIKMCSEWRYNSKSFIDWADRNGYRKGLSIERISSTDNYNPENCKWIPRAEQQWNKRDTKYVSWEGSKVRLAALAVRYGFQYQTVIKRIQSGWTLAESLLTARKR